MPTPRTIGQPAGRTRSLRPLSSPARRGRLRACSGRAGLARRVPDELLFGGVPAPGVVGSDVRAADPAVDAEEFDAVGFAAERAFSGRGQAQVQACEPLAVAERRRFGKFAAVRGFDEPRLSPPESTEDPVEPGVAEERRLLQSLRRDEGGRWCPRAGGDRMQRPSFRPGQAVCRRRQLLQQPPQCGAEERELRGLARRPLGQRRRLRRLECGPGARGRLERGRFGRTAGRPERLQLARGQLAQAGEGRLAGEGPDDDQLGRATCSASASASTSRSCSWS